MTNKNDDDNWMKIKFICPLHYRHTSISTLLLHNTLSLFHELIMAPCTMLKVNKVKESLKFSVVF
jgi:hypothetical protein